MSYHPEPAAGAPEGVVDEASDALDAPDASDNPEGELGDAAAPKPYY